MKEEINMIFSPFFKPINVTEGFTNTVPSVAQSTQTPAVQPNFAPTHRTSFQTQRFLKRHKICKAEFWVNVCKMMHKACI